MKPDGLVEHAGPAWFSAAWTTLYMVLAWILGFAFLGSVGAVAGAGSFLLLPERLRERMVPSLVSYAAGTLLAAALPSSPCRRRVFSTSDW